MNTKRTTALLTAGFALAAAPALADRPDGAGGNGKSKTPASKGVGFTVAGVDLTGLSVTDGALTGALSLDPTSANSHARSFLGLTRAELNGEDLVSFGTSGDKVLVRYVGLASTDVVQPTDRVKVIGKVTRVRKSATATVRRLDIRRITVTRGAPEGPASTTAATTSASSQEARSTTAPGQACRNESRKKVAGQRKTAFATCVSGFKRQQVEQARPAGERKNPAETCAGERKKKAEGQKKSPYASCVSGAAKAQQAARS